MNQRLPHLVRRLRAEGGRGVARRVVRRAYDRLQAGALEFPLLPGDVADSTRMAAPPPLSVPRGQRLTVGWLCAPPGAGSGGHTTMFRMVQALEQAGHRCLVLVYDRHGGDLRQHAQVVREAWPWVRAEVVDVDSGLRQVDACVATGWPTAHLLASRPTRAHRFYFIQDFEPFFFPRGSEYELAADTYRFGFTNIALGEMVRSRLSDELGVASTCVPFSCDTGVYSLHHQGPRSGVVFYTKPKVARRGYQLGALALREFHERHPEQEIHLYGEPAPDIGVPVTRHARLTPAELNDLYNRCLGGLAMSFTNISLIAEEMLAAGCVPVVNDSRDARADLPNPAVAWSSPTPGALADALSNLVTDPDQVVRAKTAAESVRRDNWSVPGEMVVRIIEDQVHAESR